MWWSAALLLFYTIFGFFILPLIVRAIAVKQISKELDRETSIRQVKINPFVLSASVRGLLIKDKDGEPFISWDEFFANFQLSSFFGKAWVFKEVHASQPFLRVQINPDYSLNFSDILKKFSTNAPASRGPSKPLFLDIERFEIAGARAQMADLTLATPFRRVIGPLDLLLTRFQTSPDSKNPYSLSGTTQNGERFTWNGLFSLDPIRSAGEFALEALSIPKYEPLYENFVRYDIRDGTVTWRFSYDFTMSGSNWAGGITNAAFTLQSLKIGEKGAATNLVELDRAAVAGFSADLATCTARMENLFVDGARINLLRDTNQQVNLVELAQPPPNATNTPGGVLFLLRAVTNAIATIISTTNLWSATLDHLDVTNCAVSLEDLANARPVQARVDDFALTGRDLSNVGKQPQTATISCRFNTNGTARVDASATLHPTSADIAINVKDVDLHPLDPYLQPFVNVFIRNSRIALDGKVTFRTSTNSLPIATFRGNARLDDFASVDGYEQQDLVKWTSLQVKEIQAELNPPSIAVKEVNLVDPCVRVAVETNTELNLLAVLATGVTNSSSGAAGDPGPPLPPKQDAPAASPTKKGGLGGKLGGLLQQTLESDTNTLGTLPNIAVETVTISNGCIVFNDRSVQPPVATSILELNGRVGGFSSDELKRADLRLTGKANRTGPFEVTGKINPLSTNTPTELVVILHDADLSPLSSYSGKFLGYKLNRGMLAVQVNYEISQRRLRATNLLTLNHLTLGEKVDSPDATKLPVRLAVALLKDRNGNILLDVPVEGSLDDPEFRFGRVVGRVLVNMITKLVTSPFAALGALFGGKGEEVSFIEFAPGRSDVPAAAVEKIQTLLHGLEERPALELEIQGNFEPSADADGLRREKLEQQLRQDKWQGLRKPEQTRTSPGQIMLTPDDRRYALSRAYNAMIKTNEAAMTAGMTTKSTTATPPVANSPSASGDKGARQLMGEQSELHSGTAAEAMESAILAGISVSKDDFKNLALARAQAVQQKIFETGKIETNRIHLAESPGTNQLPRVVFNLQ
jgi:hypothetical protein